ncbi:Hypothetical predicted protein [Olea europaea subsp. europaea]|uniref:Plant basic secretory protein (BSP) family protein n=1 Tax=Olea europaea subsp. europaea TaxID=158383 RepID=A0A8S0S2Z2_OLEEU|nr:Hypothetical predicted protein [Olea europaea subsp. europaea]
MIVGSTFSSSNWNLAMTPDDVGESLLCRCFLHDDPVYVQFQKYPSPSHVYHQSGMEPAPEESLGSTVLIPLIFSLLLYDRLRVVCAHLNYGSVITVNAAIQGIHAVDYTFTNTAANTPGAVRFTNEIGEQYSIQTLDAATNFIWKIFQQDTTPADRKNIQKVSLFIDDMDGIAYTSNDEIHVSARYIQSDSGDVKTGFTGVLYHEMTHVWQWNGNGQALGGLIEGIADYVRLKVGYVASHWVKPGEGDTWDQGYDVTAQFLDYCESLKSGFVAELNKKMRDGYY